MTKKTYIAKREATSYNIDERRQRYLESSTSKRSLFLSDSVPGKAADCQDAWVVEEKVEEFLENGWDFVFDISGNQISRVFHSRVKGGSEISYGMQIPSDWYQVKQKMQENSRKERKQMMNLGKDKEMVVGKNGAFLAEGHKVSHF